MATQTEIEIEAKKLAQSYVESEPGLKSVYWFPDQSNNEIRIIDVVDGYFTSPSIETIDVFVFKHTINNQLINLLVGTIPPSLENQPVIPSEWGAWSKAIKVYG